MTHAFVRRSLFAVIMSTVLVAVLPERSSAQATRSGASDSATVAAQPPRRQWYERLSLRGYAQFRYNRLLETNPSLTCQQCDRSIGRGGGFFLRRGRLIVSGDVSDRVSIYVQPDYATDVSGSLHVLQLRDAYFDLWLDKQKEFRLRFGQSKVPFGFENLQSSSNRLPLDRADPTNSALPNERDIGVFAYYSPTKIRQRFRMLIDSGLKGSGDYGMIGVGAYNGQTANRPEANENLHTVLRVSYPFRLANGQFIETGIQGYTGRFAIPASQRTSGVGGPPDYLDQRAAASLIIYPQPLGLQAEWNIGTGPEIDPATRVIGERHLDGGYVQVMYRHTFDGQTLIPFARAQRFDGGKKAETDARSYQVRELELGAEWLPTPAFELTAMYTISRRRFEDAANPNNLQKGQLLRLQAQFNY
jgi:hypothetical protein